MARSYLNFNCVLRFAICLHFSFLGLAAQVPRPEAEQDEVVRVFTDLVQTDFMVLDKAGRFVEGLKREDFQLTVDGNAVPIRFFDLIKSGTPNEEAQLAAARGETPKAGAGAPALQDRGRPIFFFVDDLHLTASSLDQTSKLLLRFIDQDLKQNDEAQIASASGRLGFLQQLTDNKAVLRKAVERLRVRGRSARDLEHPPMSEFEALQVDRGDRDAFEFFVGYLMQNRMMSRPTAEAEVRRRAAMILEQVASSTTTTLSSLEAFVKAWGKLPGRKLVFLVSDGFFIDTKHSNTTERMRSIISAAARSGVVIYSIDARGLIATLNDASRPPAIDRTHRMERARIGEIGQSQDVLNALARDTGGRALFDNNNLHLAVENGLRETSKYYVVAWRPERAGNNASRFRQVSLTVIGRSDLTVRVRRGFLDVEPTKKTNESASSKAPKDPETRLKEAIVTTQSNREIPISLSLNYFNGPNEGMALSVSMQIPREFLPFESDPEKAAQIYLAGAVFDDQGQSKGAFRERITVRTAPGAREPQRDLAFTHKVLLPPGLYQVRVAALDLGSGHIGGTNSWVEIPDLAKREFALSSLLVGERAKSDSADTQVNNAALPDSIFLKVDRRFRREALLRYVVFIYNAAVSASQSKPDVVAQVQVLRNGQPVAATPLKHVALDGAGDSQRIPYAAELPLDDFPPGQYVLQFTAIDRIAKRSASQRVRFEVH
jgi:VWFA-related protein